jgi:hypothetical protein
MNGTRFWTAVAVACSGAALAAQAPQTGASAGQRTPASPVVTVVGCVQKASSVLKHNPAAGAIGMDEEFVLTGAALNPGPGDEPKANPPEEAVGMSGSLGLGRVYRATGDRGKDLKPYVGQRVEITGVFTDGRRPS